MKFVIENNKIIGSKQLIYIEEECSFYTGEIADKFDIEVVVNTISLFVADKKVIDIGGFCGLSVSMVSNCKVPKYTNGILLIEDNLESGFAYGVNKEDLPVSVNPQTGWVCIGNPDKSGKAVEFINNCVAVIGDDKEFVSLWLKPQSLPKEFDRDAFGDIIEIGVTPTFVQRSAK